MGKNICKRTLSTVLALFMVLTTFCFADLGFTMTASAAISTAESFPTVTFYVPETIYLSRADNKKFAYFADRANSVNGALTASVNTKTTGNVYFNCSGATNVKITATGASISGSNLGAASSGSSLAITNISGSASSALNPGATAQVNWVAEYTLDGKACKAYAYSTMYAPMNTTVVGAAGRGYNYHGNSNYCQSVLYAIGVHQLNATGSHGANDALLAYVKNGTSYGEFNDNSVDGALISSSATIKGINYSSSSGSSKNGNKCATVTAPGSTIWIDSSRYTNFSQIPNLMMGWQCTDDEDDGGSKWGYYNITCGSATVHSRSWGSLKNMEQEPLMLRQMTGAISGYGSATPLVLHCVCTSCDTDSSSADRAGNDLTISIGIEKADKSLLRTTINDEIAKGRQAEWYTNASWNTYKSKMATAYAKLGEVKSTTADVTAGVNAVTEAVNALVRTSYTATVSHKLPAQTGFTYTYNGTTYTAVDGYITISESKTFNSGSNVTMTAENSAFNGFTPTGTTSVTKKNQTSNVSQSFTYKAATSTINFNYGNGLDSYVQDKGDASKTVTYGQPYGTLPTAKMDGWRFNGWKDGNNATVTANTVCTMISGQLDLTADWSCYFSGGHGTAADPFKITTVADLQYIDDTTKYCILTNNSCTKGKYYTQTTDISYTPTATPVVAFNGNYDGANHTITVSAGKTIADTTYGGIFGNISGASIANIKVNLDGKFGVTGTGSTYAGFIGAATSSTIENIQIVTGSGSDVKATNAGVLAGSATSTTIKNCSVVLNGGSLTADAFVGKKSSSTLNNTWVLVRTTPTGFTTSSANNLMRIRENGTVNLAYNNGAYTFTAVANSGWSVEYRNASDGLVMSGASYSPAASANGLDIYACFVKSVTLAAGNNGTLTSAGTYNLRQGQVISNITPTPNTGYTFTGFTNGTDGKFSASAPYTFTMGVSGGNITANFTVNTYTLVYDANANSAQIDVPGAAVYKSSDKVIIASAPVRAGYTFLNWNSQRDGKGTPYVPNQEYSALSTTNGVTITLYAIWSTNKYTVTFEANSGTAVSPITDILYGANITFPTTTRTGYKNLKWHTDSAFSDSGYLPGTTKQIYADATFYAEWTPITYTIAFSADGASNVPASVSVRYDGDSFQIPASYVPAKAGYIFKGWDTAANGNGTRYFVLDKIPKNLTTVDGDTITLFAQWQEATYAVEWDLTGGTLDGSATNPSTTVTFGGLYTVPYGTPIKAGCQFDGWYTATTGGSKITNNTTVSITADTSFYAHWSAANYTIVYNKNGGKAGTMDNTVATYGQEATLRTNTYTRPGYAFTGWNTEPDGSGFAFGDGAKVTNLTSTHNAKVNLYAQWTGSRFSITYNLNGATGSLLATNVTMEGNAVALRANTKTLTADGSNYVFYGWAYTQADAAAMKKAYDNKADFALNEDVLAKCVVNWDAATPTITLYAVWARITTVTWNLVGGKLNESTDNIITNVTYGDKYVLPVGAPEKNRYQFVGWYTAPENGTGTEVTNSTVLMTQEDTTIYAHWVQTGNLDSTYKTEYYLQNADGSYPSAPNYSSTSTSIIGTNVEAAVTSYAGYSFDAANENNVIAGIVTDAEFVDQLVLKVYYTINWYSVSFNANGGTGSMDAQTLAYGTATDLNACGFTRKGYTFQGWARTADGAVAYADGGHFTIGTENVELFAVWSKQTYTITFDTVGGTPVEKIEACFGEPITAPADPEKEGYIFENWVVTGTPGVYTIPATMPDANISLTASWKAIDYTLTYDANGAEGTMASSVFHVSDRVTLADVAFTKLGYTFAGWATSADGSVKYLDGASFIADAQNIALYAIWTANRYTIEFRGNGSNDSMDSIKCTYDSTYTLPANQFTKIGASFCGWATTASGAVAYADGETVSNLSSDPDATVILYAVWENIPYTVTFNANGATQGTAPEAISVVYGQKITLPAATLAVESDETAESRTFLGWTAADGTEYAVGATFDCPAEDIVFNALYSANYYALNEITARVKGYRDSNALPASVKTDPLYAADGDIAVELHSDGTYAWSCFNTTALEAAYTEAVKVSYRGLKQSEQDTIDVLVETLGTALDNVTLNAVDYDYVYACTQFMNGDMDPYTGLVYPTCTDETTHSFNQLKAAVDAILNEKESTSLYTEDSIEALRIEVYGNGRNYAGIVKDVADANLKVPAQNKLSSYVAQLAEAYHTLPQLKVADYSRVDSLIDEYLPTRYNVSFGEIYAYFTAESVSALTEYYDTYDREIKIVSQEIVDDEIYNTLRQLIDDLVPGYADYTDVFYQILRIPSGTEGFSYPASNVVATNYEAWMNWALANSGAISTAIDAEFLDARYTASSVAALNKVLDGIDWQRGIFEQNAVNGTGEGIMSYMVLVSNAVDALQLRNFTVTFVTNDGTDNVYTTEKGNSYGDTVALPKTDPTREGYNFLGWSADTDGVEMLTGSIIVTGDMTVYAIWEEIYVPDLELIIPEGATTIIDEEKGFIYGLKQMVTKEELNETYLGVIGKGHLEYDYVGYIGTGDTVRLIDDQTGETVATYTIVIFGDLDGDGRVTNQDISAAKMMNAALIDYTMNDASAFAADIFADDNVNNADIDILKRMSARLVDLDQATRALTIIEE